MEIVVVSGLKMILSLILIAVVMTTSSSKTISNRDENSLQDERDQVQPQKDAQTEHRMRRSLERSDAQTEHRMRRSLGRSEAQTEHRMRRSLERSDAQTEHRMRRSLGRSDAQTEHRMRGSLERSDAQIENRMSRSLARSAVATVLQSAKLIYASGKTRMFKKQGGVNEAWRDFKAFNPTLLSDDVKVKVGRSGKKVVIFNSDMGQPFLEVRYYKRDEFGGGLRIKTDIIKYT